MTYKVTRLTHLSSAASREQVSGLEVFFQLLLDSHTLGTYLRGLYVINDLEVSFVVQCFIEQLDAKFS